MNTWWTLVVLALVACDDKPRAAPAPALATPATPPAAPKTEPVTSPADMVREALPVVQHGLAWYEDAMPAARAAAERDARLLFVDLWAPWCHTCLSMREHVLTSETFAGVGARLVYVALNTELAENASTLRQLPIGAWPTFYLVDTAGEVYGRWVGAASPVQLQSFVRDGLRAHDDRQVLPPGDPLASLIEGDRSAADHQLEAARAAYERALARSPAGWPRRADAWVSLLGVLNKLADHAACADAGLRGLAETGRSASVTDFCYWALDCTRALPRKDPRVRVLQRRMAGRLRGLCEQGSDGLSPDDRGDACGLLHAVSEQLHDAAGARRADLVRLQVLAAAAALKPDAIARTYDAARAEALLSLGRGEEALALLSERERALPDAYDPPYLLARTYRALARPGEGLSAIDRALARVPTGTPRAAAMLGLRAELLVSLERTDEARATLVRQLAAYRALPEGQQQPLREQAVAEKLAGLK